MTRYSGGVLSLLAAAMFSRGINLDAMDRSAVISSPADLNQFANGSWSKVAKIAPDKMSSGVWDEMEERNRALLRSICERAAKSNRPLSTNEGKVGLMYRLGKDRARADRQGVRPLREELAEIGLVNDRRSLARELGRLTLVHSLTDSSTPGFAVGVNQDDKDPGRMLVTIIQGGQILPDRDLYLQNDDRGKGARKAYVFVGENYLKLAGLTGDPARSLALEKGLAQASSTPVQLRDLEANYHVLTLAKLRKLTPHFDWSAYFGALGIAPPKLVNVNQPRFLAAFNRAVASESMATWRTYLRLHLLQSYAPHLSEAFVAQKTALDKVLYGTEQALPRWKRAISATDGTVGEALGRLYVQVAFTPAAKQRANVMVENVKAAMGDRIRTAAWMAPATKRQALAKLRTLRVKIGYPDRWIDYSKLRLKDDSLAQNVMRGRAFEWRRQLAKLGKPIDRNDWGMTTPTINAYENPYWNEIVFPAGIMQPPFFDLRYDDAVNYGIMGSIIGHELSHDFDDQGSQFDETGRRRNWWTAEDKRRFDAAGKAIVDQYEKYKSSNGYPVIGRLTLGENIGDVAGVAISFDAYKRSLKGKQAPEIDGFTGEQRFFLAWAQGWRTKMRPEIDKMLSNTNPHSPDNARVEGPAADNPNFYKAFGLPVPPKLPRVW